LAAEIATGGEMVGRPSNGTKQYPVQLEPEQVARIDAITGETGKKHARSAWIRKAIDAALDKP
jgi:hypothetical protein